jgi:hypothetical protein
MEAEVALDPMSGAIPLAPYKNCPTVVECKENELFPPDGKEKDLPPKAVESGL